MANKWTRGAAHRHTTAPISALDLHPEIYLLIAIFAIGEQKSVLAKQCGMSFITGDENAKGQGCNSFGILHLKLCGASGNV